MRLPARSTLHMRHATRAPRVHGSSTMTREQEKKRADGGGDSADEKRKKKKKKKKKKEKIDRDEAGDETESE